jgi:hypothetical protein
MERFILSIVAQYVLLAPRLCVCWKVVVFYVGDEDTESKS